MKWFSNAVFFFSRDESIPVTINHPLILKVHSEQKKNWLTTWGSSRSLLWNLAASCSLGCPRPQEVAVMLTKSRLNPWLRSEGSFSHRHISKGAEHVMWSRPEETCSLGGGKQLGHQLRLEKGFSRSSWHCTYAQVLNNDSESRGDFSQWPRVNCDFFVIFAKSSNLQSRRSPMSGASVRGAAVRLGQLTNSSGNQEKKRERESSGSFREVTLGGLSWKCLTESSSACVLCVGGLCNLTSDKHVVLFCWWQMSNPYGPAKHWNLF